MSRVHSPSWLGPGLIFLFVVPLLVYGAYSIGDRWYQNYILTQQEEAIRADVMRLRDENIRLQHELVVARSDAGIEKIARIQLGLVRPGDTALQIVGPSGGTASSVQAPTPPDAEAASTQPARVRPAWLKFLDSLFGR
jgi:cell division protein FtsB